MVIENLCNVPGIFLEYAVSQLRDASHVSAINLSGYQGRVLGLIQNNTEGCPLCCGLLI
jgi:hypothetical protein